MLTPQQIAADREELHADIPQLNWSRLPEYMHEALERWILYGIVPGEFLTAVLSNDLVEACIRADDLNKHLLYEYVHFLYNHAPRECWGGPLTFESWHHRGGLKEYKRELT